MSTVYTIVHTECSTGWGGQEIRIFSEMTAMRARGHRLLLCAPTHSRIYQECQQAGFTVYPLDDRKASYPLTILKLARLFRREKVQIVNPHSSRDGWLSGVAGRLARAPLIIRSRHIEVDYPHRFLSRIAFVRLPHHIITTSKRISARLIAELGLPETQTTCIATGVDLARFNATVTGRLHEELGLDKNLPLVGMISVLRSWKGHAIFVSAAKEIVRACPQVHFVIAGEGQAAQAGIASQVQQAGLEKYFTLLGYRQDVPELLASLAILVLPSTAHEGIPQIILQAQAMSCAVVGTTIGGIPEVVQDQETGLLVPPGDPAALADRIVRLLKDPALRQRLGQQARKQIEREHSLVRMCEQLEQLYARYLR